MSVFDKNETSKSHLDRKMFLDGQVAIQRFETSKYPQLLKFSEKALSFYWVPEEIDVSKDVTDFKNKLSDHERHIFTSNLKRQILLDSVQGRAPFEAFGPLVSLPVLELWISIWAGFECFLHSKSYSHIIKAVYPDPSVVFDELLDIEEIVECSNDVSRDYDALIEYGQWYQLLGEGTHTVNGKKIEISKYELKRLIWRGLFAALVLESVRFYASFVTSWLPAENRKVMEGNANIIKMICRDENIHMGVVQQILRLMPKDDPDFAKIKEEEEEYVTKMFVDTIEQEKKWGAYLFRDGSVVGLNEQLLNDYLEWLGNDRMKTAGLKSPYTVPRANPLPWTMKWIAGAEVQVAPQETEKIEYTSGDINENLSEDSLKDFKL